MYANTSTRSRFYFILNLFIKTKKPNQASTMKKITDKVTISLILLSKNKTKKP